ncbi:uncharacterized protein [Triticum aestivum]|nr:uncharacterized protein LOC123059129 [Triticum aestivum]
METATQQPTSLPLQAAATLTRTQTRHHRRHTKRSKAEQRAKGRHRIGMILVAVMAELLEEYTAAVARALERLLSAAPLRILPRRVRFVVLRPLPFASPSAPVPPPPPHAVPVLLAR